eukprot:6457100-Amphidinium_carterae.2
MAPDAHESGVCAAHSAGFSGTPTKAFQDVTKVAWSKAESLDEPKKLAKEGMKDLPPRQELEGARMPWTLEAAPFIIGSTSRGGSASYGLRLPPDVFTKVQERLGKDVRRRYTVTGAPRSWMQDDIEICMPILRWEGEVKYASRGQWIVRASEDLGRWTVVVGCRYERCTLIVEDLTLAKEARQKATEAQILKQPPVARQETWKTLLKALPLPAGTEQDEDNEQPSTEAPWITSDASAIQERLSETSDFLDDKWCEEEVNMYCDWVKDEYQDDKFEPRKRKVNEQ